MKITIDVRPPKYNKSEQCKNFRIPKEEYWHCMIGPADRSELPQGADFPMRMNIQRVFEAVIGRPAADCRSGWGHSMEEHDAEEKVRYEFDKMAAKAEKKGVR